jgi:hypothetical protein
MSRNSVIRPIPRAVLRIRKRAQVNESLALVIAELSGVRLYDDSLEPLTLPAPQGLASLGWGVRR